jgi:hypothetical protein
MSMVEGLSGLAYIASMPWQIWVGVVTVLAIGFSHYWLPEWIQRVLWPGLGWGVWAMVIWLGLSWIGNSVLQSVDLPESIVVPPYNEVNTVYILRRIIDLISLSILFVVVHALGFRAGRKNNNK